MRQCGAEINATRKRKETVAAKQNQTEPWISLAAWCRTWRRFHTCNFWTGPNSEVWTKQAIVKVINNTFAFPAISSQQVRDDKYPDQCAEFFRPVLGAGPQSVTRGKHYQQYKTWSWHFCTNSTNTWRHQSELFHSQDKVQSVSSVRQSCFCLWNSLVAKSYFSVTEFGWTDPLINIHLCTNAAETSTDC